MRAERKTYVACWAFLLGAVLCFSQNRKSKGEVLIYKYEYQKAVRAHVEEGNRGHLDLGQQLNLADASFKVSNQEKAAQVYLDLPKKDTLMDGLRYTPMLRCLTLSGD